MTVDVALVHGLSLFSSLSEEQLGKVAKLCSEKTISAGQTIHREGEPGKAIFMVLQGDVEVLFTAGGVALACMEWVRAGEILGIRAFFPPYRYLSTAHSLTEGRLLEINAIKLRELCEQDSRLAIFIHECLMQAMLNRVVGLRANT
jgi:CRP-like cAMP-binding protein